MARIAIVTGGASGIGAAVSAALVARGDTVVVADIDHDGATRVAANLGERASEADLDVRDGVAVRDLVDATVAEHGRIDLMFNNAGIGMGGSALELTNEHWDRVIDINVRGVVHGVNAALPHMVRQGDGHIVNTASLAGLIPTALLAPYVATKHAVAGMTMSLRLEFAEQGVRFTAVCPGFTDTPILDKATPEDLPGVTRSISGRALAESLPGGVYELDLLVADILSGVDRNDALVVAPSSARHAWRAFRMAPTHYLKVVGKQFNAAVARVEQRAGQ